MKAITGADARIVCAQLNQKFGYPSAGRHCRTGEIVPEAITTEHAAIVTDGATEAILLDPVADAEVKKDAVMYAKAVAVDPANFNPVPIDAGEPEVG